MPGPLSGLDLIRHVKDERPEILLIVITAHGSIETAVEAMRLGAQDYVTKPVNLGALRIQVRHAFEHHRLREENRRLRDRLAALRRARCPKSSARAPSITELLGQVAQIADTDVTVMIEGESGTGKGLIARALHDVGSRRDRAVRRRERRRPARVADRQRAVRLRAGGLQRRDPPEGRLARDGRRGHALPRRGRRAASSRPRSTCSACSSSASSAGSVASVRIPAGRPGRRGHQPRRRRARRRRPDAVRPVLPAQRRPPSPPPLRERRDDIPHLIRHFIERAALRHNREIKQVAGSAMRLLRDYAWPGNLRQLRNIVERLVVTVEAADDPGRRPAPRAARRACLAPRSPPSTTPSAEAETAAILAALAHCNQHRERTARLLGVSVRTLHYKMNRYDLQ